MFGKFWEYDGICSKGQQNNEHDHHQKLQRVKWVNIKKKGQYLGGRVDNSEREHRRQGEIRERVACATLWGLKKFDSMLCVLTLLSKVGCASQEYGRGVA